MAELVSLSDEFRSDSGECDDDLTDINLAKLYEQPSLEEFNNPKHEFKVKLEESGSREVSVFSQKLNRLFTTTDKSLIFNMSMSPHTPLTARVMFVCSNQIYQPLSRCSHHIRGDNTTFREHVVTHRDSTARYVGTAQGMYFRDRLAILVPIAETGQKSITLDFKCLSSCFKIKNIATALVFTLENEETDQILGRQLFNVHVSKNFKRDAEAAEKGVSPIKRPLEPVSSSSRETVVDLSELRFLLSPELAGDLLKNIERFFKAQLYNANDETSVSLTKSLEIVSCIMQNLEKSTKSFSVQQEKLTGKSESKVKKKISSETISLHLDAK